MVLVVVVEGALVVVVVPAVVEVVLEGGAGVVGGAVEGGADVEVVVAGATVAVVGVEDGVLSAMAFGIPKAPRPAMTSAAAIPVRAPRSSRRIIPPSVGPRSAWLLHASPNGPSPRHGRAI
jgi:hypothetical protein